jgi:hypothetical protein
MAQTDRFMIAPLNQGMQTDLKPWLIPDDAFQELTNLYIFRGRVRKRFGTLLMNSTALRNVAQLYSRVRILVGTTNSSGNNSGTVPGEIFGIGQLFSIGNQIFTVYQLGTPANMLNTGIGTGTYNTSNGNFVFTGVTPSTNIYFYPAQPIMGLINYSYLPQNNTPTFAFDTQFAYQYNGTSWIQLSAAANPGDEIWTGDNSQFFWGCNWIGTGVSQTYLFVTNYNYGNDLTDTDLLRYWDGTQWNSFNPALSSTDATYTMVTSRLIVVFQNYLVFLNVVENQGMAPGTNSVYVNRARWSAVNNVLNDNSFYSDTASIGGGFKDAPTKESIISAQFIKDRLIVFFESSTWELVYTGNYVSPFIWQQLNTELGCQSTFSEVPFDKVVLGVGNTGIHACNGSNVERIDNKIPDTVFNITNANQGIFRVYGIRDYYTELVYWTFPSNIFNQTFPNRILVYNYKTGSWAFFVDSFTVFGYYQQQSNMTWQNTETWANSTQTWASAPLLPEFQQVIAGNQEGFIFILSSTASYNEESLQITNMVNSGPAEDGTLVTITSIDHNLVQAYNNGASGDYVLIDYAQGINGINEAIYAVNTVIDTNTFTIIVPQSTPVMGTYIGGGTIARISNVNLITKQYNFYVQDGRNAQINKVDFLVDRTPSGQVTIDYSVSSSNESILTSNQVTNTLTGSSVLETSPYDLVPLEQFQDRLWHPVYLWAEGECIQLNIYMSDEQIRDLTNSLAAFSDFTLHAMTFYTQPTSSRLQ